MTQPEKLFVRDTTALDDERPRVHTQMIGGKPMDYAFYRGKPLPLEFAVAMKFLKVDSFIVSTDEAGLHRYKPTAEGKTTDGSKLVLQPDQCIANYEELMQEFLVIRANQRPGGEGFKKNAKRADLIAFLSQGAAELEQAKAAAGAPQGNDGEQVVVEEIGGDGLSDGEANELFGGNE